MVPGLSLQGQQETLPLPSPETGPGASLGLFLCFVGGGQRLDLR